MAAAFGSEAIPVTGKTALVTGASSGIGKVVSVRLAKQGCNVVLAARRLEKLEEVNYDINNLKPEGNISPGKSVAIVLDVSGASGAIASGVDKAWGAFGGIDILVNNAGVIEAIGGDSLSATDTEWDNVLHTNVKGAGLVIQSVAKHMIASKKGGSIINIASINGTERGVMEGTAIYCASKAALIQMTRVHAMELGPYGIRVNAIAPGLFESEMTSPLWESAQEKVTKKVPMQRWGTVDPDLTAPIILLATDVSSYMTGATFVVDGGYTLGLKSLIDTFPIS